MLAIARLTGRAYERAYSEHHDLASGLSLEVMVAQPAQLRDITEVGEMDDAAERVVITQQIAAQSTP